MPKKSHVRKYLRCNGCVLWKDTDHEYYRQICADGAERITEAEYYAGL